MQKSFSILFICLLTILGPLGLQAYQSAHVITVGFDIDKKGNERKYVLLGLTHKGKLSTFGGLRDPGERDPKKTASRETEEEALGVLGNQKTIRKMLEQVNPLYEVGGHICYVLPKKNYGKDVSAKFIAIRFNKNISLTSGQKEMVDIVAIEVDLVREKVLQNEPLFFADNKGTLRPLRVEVERVFIEAVAADYL